MARRLPLHGRAARRGRVQRRPKLHLLPRLLGLAAARSAQPLVKNEVARDAGLHAVTLDEYLGYLETVFLVRTVQAWASSPTTARTRTPKVHVTDTGLASALLGIDADRLARDPARAGPLLESFVVNELGRQLAAAGATRYALSHLRTRDGREVDVVLERADGRVAAVEVKGGATVRAGDARNLRWLAERLGDRFVSGVLLYTGDRVVALGDRITLVPISRCGRHRTMAGKLQMPADEGAALRRPPGLG